MLLLPMNLWSHEFSVSVADVLQLDPPTPKGLRKKFVLMNGYGFQLLNCVDHAIVQLTIEI